MPIGDNQTISQPYIVALMTELLELPPKAPRPRDRHRLGLPERRPRRRSPPRSTRSRSCPSSRAWPGEKLKELGYANVVVREGDGYRGWIEHAPFDGIIVTAAPERIPQPLLEQLAPGGRMVIPVGGFFQELKVFTKDKDGRVTEKDIIPVRFVPMTGEIEKEKTPEAP